MKNRLWNSTYKMLLQIYWFLLMLACRLPSCNTDTIKSVWGEHSPSKQLADMRFWHHLCITNHTSVYLPALLKSKHPLHFFYTPSSVVRLLTNVGIFLLLESSVLITFYGNCIKLYEGCIIYCDIFYFWNKSAMEFKNYLFLRCCHWIEINSPSFMSMLFLVIIGISQRGHFLGSK